MKNLILNLCCAAAVTLVAPSALAQLAITDIGTTAPTPISANDLTNLFDGYQFNDGLNYWWDNGRNNGQEIGQTFTTGNNAGGYTVTNLAIKTAGGGGSGELTSQTFILNFYSVDGSGNATYVAGVTNTGKLTKEGDWLQWNGLGVPLQPGTVYAYTLIGGAGYEELSDNGQNPYAGGQICTVTAGGGAVTYGGTGNSDATFDIGLALGAVAGGTVAITDLGVTAPTPGANDVYQLVGDAQDSYGMNYYWDSNPGETFTTPNNTVPWIMNRLAVKWAGGGGGGDLGSQFPIIRIYSVANGTTATLVYSNSPANPVALASENGEWWDCTGLSVPLEPNKQYAYTVSRQNSSYGWELMATKDGNPYSGGQICLIPVAGGSISYGSQSTGNNSSDAGFIIGLTSPVVYALPPTYSPNVPTIYAGTAVTLNEAAVGSGTFSYQWQTDGGSGGTLTNVPSATSSNLVVDTTSLVAGVYNYQVIVTTTANGGISSTSAPVQLNIAGASMPVIDTDTTASPNTTVNYVGNSQSFSVALEGTLPIGYQWYMATDASGTGATAISGATNATLTFNSLTLTNSGFYAVTATNLIGSAASTYVQLSVLPANQMLFHWLAPVAFDGLTAGQILTNAVAGGSFFEAAYISSGGSPISVVINGVTYPFSTDSSAVSFSGQAGMTTGAYLLGTGTTTGDSDFDNVLDHFGYDGGSHTITLHNLTVGTNYYVQIFGLDDRTLASSRSCNYQDPNSGGDVSANIGMTDNKYVVGTFTAPSTDVAILQNLLPGGQGNINAVVVGTVNVATQPTSVPLGYGISGKTLNLTWPAGQGWRLVGTTNILSASSWATVPVTTDGSYSIAIDPSKATMFYRLVSP